MADYRKQYRAACKAAFSGFSLDLSGCRKPEIVQKVHNLARDGLFSKEIAEALSITPKCVQKIFRRYNFPRLHNICPPQGEQRHDWKGGVKMMRGYRYVYAPDHPHRLKHSNVVAEHRLVMEKKLGRLLKRREVVDHIDGDITNNHPDNLRVFANNAEHLRVTLKGKCPRWSEEGKAAIARARSQKRRTWKGQWRAPSPDA